MRSSLMLTVAITAVLALCSAPEVVVGYAVAAAVLVFGTRWLIGRNGPLRRRGVCR